MMSQQTTHATPQSYVWKQNNDIKEDKLSTIQLPFNQEKSGKFYDISSSSEFTEMGQESADDIYCPPTTLLAECQQIAQHQLQQRENEILAQHQIQQLLNKKNGTDPNAATFTPKKETLASITEEEESICENQSIISSPASSVPISSVSSVSSMSILSSLSPSTPNPNTMPFISNTLSEYILPPLPMTAIQGIIDNSWQQLSYLPVPPSMQPLNTIAITNQFVTDSDTLHSQVDHNMDTQLIFNMDAYTHTQPQKQPPKPKQFVPKFNNHAKGNFFISKDMISDMVRLCVEPFDTNVCNDEKLAFGYFKESVAMQINDKQIRVVGTNKGDIIIINIDLHFKNYNGDIMYLIAMENDFEHKTNVQWKITEFMTADMIQNVYGVVKLPKSSRNMHHFKRNLRFPPVHVPVDVIYNTKFKSLPGKKSKRSNATKNGRINMSEEDFKWYCHESWNKQNSIMIPVVVIKGKRQWIEWKKFIQICNQQWVGISLRYYSSNRQWKIECMDYDAGRIFYQYRLVGCHNIGAKYQIDFTTLQNRITTSLNIY